MPKITIPALTGEELSQATCGALAALAEMKYHGVCEAFSALPHTVLTVEAKRECARAAFKWAVSCIAVGNPVREAFERFADEQEHLDEFVQGDRGPVAPPRPS